MVKTNFISIFQRSSARYHPLDGFRALSIIFVIIFHCFFFLQKVLNNKLPAPHNMTFIQNMSGFFNWVWQGDKGVDIFFILSGFLIATKLFNEQSRYQSLKIKQFYWQRLLRIVPVYLFVLLITLIFTRNNAEYIWSNLLFVNNFIPANCVYLPHSWSISVEMQFYFLFPFFLIYIFQHCRYKVALLVSLFLATFLIKYLIILSEPYFYTIPLYNHVFDVDGGMTERFAEALYGNLYTRGGPIILGILIAYLAFYHYQSILQWISQHRFYYNMIIILSIGLILYTISAPYHNPSSNFYQKITPLKRLFFITTNRNFFCLGMAVFIFSTLFPYGIGKSLARFFSLKIFYPIAQLSYSIYLIHPPIIALAAMIVMNAYHVDAIDYYQIVHSLTVTKVFSIVLLTLFITALFSSLIFTFIEKPFMNLSYKKRKPL